MVFMRGSVVLHDPAGARSAATASSLAPPMAATGSLATTDVGLLAAAFTPTAILPAIGAAEFVLAMAAGGFTAVGNGLAAASATGTAKLDAAGVSAVLPTGAAAATETLLPTTPPPTTTDSFSAPGGV